MKLTIVADSEKVLGKAVAIAASLKRRGLIQLYDLSSTESGVDITPYPPMADCVRDKGGWDAYLAELDAAFKSSGFKRQITPVAKVVTIVPDTEPDIAKAALIGDRLVRQGMLVSSVRNPGKDISALDITMLPAEAEPVRVAGDWSLYHSQVIENFTAAGFKLGEAPKALPDPRLAIEAKRKADAAEFAATEAKRKADADAEAKRKATEMEAEEKTRQRNLP